MRIVIQRVSEASVTIEQQVKSSIQAGLLILLGIGEEDTEEDAKWLVNKVIGLRIFDDEQGIMASYKKGNRPSWIHAARHEVSIPLYNYFCKALSEALGKPVGTGEFGADMKVRLLNDGPVTICMDTKNKE